MNRLAAQLTAAVALCLPGVASAEPIALGVQGLLRSGSGGPVADGPYALAVALYPAEDAKTALFLEKFIAVPVQSGLFALELGVLDPGKKLDDGVLFDPKGVAANLWIGVQVSADPELARVPLRAVPYAIHSRTAHKAMGSRAAGA
jgi:hypothetical protein